MNDRQLPRGSTGFFDKADNVDYVVGNDPYFRQRMKEQAELDQSGGAEPTPWPGPTPKPAAPNGGSTAPKPAAPKTTTAKPNAPKPVPATNQLTERVRQFQITRFDGGDSQKAALFGASRYRIIVFFRSEPQVAFEGAFTKAGDKLHLDSTSQNFRLTGEVTDSAPYKTTAPLRLTDLKTKDEIEISYYAFRSKPIVDEDSENPIAANSSLRQQVDALKNKYYWVNNWNVLNGPSFYLNDEIRVTSAASPSTANDPSLSFSGESKRTSADDDVHEWDTQNADSGSTSNAKLVGNSTTSNGRTFRVELEDRSSKKKNDVMVDLEPEKPDEPALEPDEIPDVDTTAPAPEEDATPEDVFTAGQPSAKSSAPTKTANTPTDKAKPAPQAVEGDAYLPVNKSLPDIARTSRDFGRTLHLRGVQRAIARFMGTSRSRLQAFYDHANPFRRFAQAIAEKLDVNPVYFYLTVDESEYFIGGNYTARNGDCDKRTGVCSAAGPFQFHVPSAITNGLRISGGRDERHYLAPSACGAGRYIRANTQLFKNSDTTLALLGYNQGAGGARTLASRYGYTWARIDRLDAGASQHAIDYVNSKLAIYFISNNRRFYRFPVKSGNERTSVPSNGTVITPGGIHDPTCAELARTYIR